MNCNKSRPNFLQIHKRFASLNGLKFAKKIIKELEFHDNMHIYTLWPKHLLTKT